MAWTVGDRSFRTRAEARAYAKRTGQKATGEYRSRIARGEARGLSRSEARGHPWWEPKARKVTPEKGAKKHRRPDVLTGRAGVDEPLPDGAALRGLRAFMRAFDGEPNVVVAIYGVPKGGQSRKRRQGMSPRILAKIPPAGSGKTAGALWISTVRPVEELLDELEYAARAGLSDAEALAGDEDSGLPEWEAVFQVEFSVPA